MRSPVLAAALAALAVVACVIGAVEARRSVPFESSHDPLNGVKLREGVIKCDVCLEFVKLVDDMISKNFTLDEMIKPAVDLCTALVFPHSEHPMCPGVIANYAPSVVFVLTNSYLSPEEVCTTLRYCESKNPKTTSPITVAQAAPMAAHAHERVQHRAAARSLQTAPSKPLKMVQFTDFHTDMYYAPGSTADCGDIVCCRSDDTVGTRRAGKFGDYDCDLPLVTVEDMLEHVKAEVQPDLIVWTGDNPPHDMWLENQTSQLMPTQKLTELLQTYFPKLPIFPALGNHESYPANLYYQPTYSWLTDALASYWVDWLPEDAQQTFRYGGYYSMKHPALSNLRIIAMNTQYSYVFNFYVILPEKDPASMIDWLKAELAKARAAGERVLLVGHIPSGRYDTVDWFGDTMMPLLEPYADLIVAWIAGHTHRDSYLVVPSSASAAQQGANFTTMMYIAPAVTTYLHINPSFRVYELDPTTYEVLNYQQYHVNLTRANAEGHITWELFYDAKQAYGLADLSTDSWFMLSTRMLSSTGGAFDHDVASEYTFYKETGYAERVACDDMCAQQIFCETISLTFADYHLCMQDVHADADE